ncbi:dethiobiotin synthase [Candidatus Marinamargulisbacteria bacterium SCGC AG-414-C22]|nr:dethiobiotin synthase [Candidatus Marinamargulisbacteria bacterium SCGC AG-414-C22]
MFITGTNTDVGKTIVTGLIARYFIDKNINTITQKWVQTGCESFSPDIQTHWLLSQKTKQDYAAYLTDICPYHFTLPASAHLAAKKDNITINPSTIITAFKKLYKTFSQVIVEGIGGIMVPLTNSITTLHIIKQLNLPVIIVFSNELGAINHTLLTIETCKKNNIPIIGLISNQTTSSIPNKDIFNDNPKIIETLSAYPLLTEIPYLKNINPTTITKEPFFIKLSQQLDHFYNRAI